MNIIEWRQNPELVKQSAKIIEDPFFQQMLKVVESVQDYNRDMLGTSADDKAMALGSMIGFKSALTNLRSLGTVLMATNREIESRFEDPEA